MRRYGTKMHTCFYTHTHTHTHTYTHTHTGTHTHTHTLTHTLTLHNKEEHLEVGAANFRYKTEQCLSFVVDQNVAVEYTPPLILSR